MRKKTYYNSVMCSVYCSNASGVIARHLHQYDVFLISDSCMNDEM